MGYRPRRNSLGSKFSWVYITTHRATAGTVLEGANQKAQPMKSLWLCCRISCRSPARPPAYLFVTHLLPSPTCLCHPLACQPVLQDKQFTAPTLNSFALLKTKEILPCKSVQCPLWTSHALPVLSASVRQQTLYFTQTTIKPFWLDNISSCWEVRIVTAPHDIAMPSLFSSHCVLVHAHHMPSLFCRHPCGGKYSISREQYNSLI